eukprot:3339700-Rhodomonas_salina.1
MSREQRTRGHVQLDATLAALPVFDPGRIARMCQGVLCTNLTGGERRAAHLPRDIWVTNHVPVIRDPRSRI